MAVTNAARARPEIRPSGTVSIAARSNITAPAMVSLQAARDAAPYVHSKMQTIELSGPDGDPIEITAIPVDPAEAMATYKQLMD